MNVSGPKVKLSLSSKPVVLSEKPSCIVYGAGAGCYPSLNL